MGETARCSLLVAIGIVAFAVSRFVDAGLVHSLLVGVACGAVYLALALPTGVLIESHTGERLVKWVWFVVLGIFAVGTFISFYGVGEVTENVARQHIERGEAPADTKVGSLKRGPLE